MNIHSNNLMQVGSFRGLPQFIQGSLFLYLISFASMAQPPQATGSLSAVDSQRSHRSPVVAKV